MDSLAPLSFLPLRLSRNAVAYTIDPAPDSIVDRANLSYKLAVQKPKTYGSGEFTELITLPGRELPKRSELGADVFPGAEFDVSVFLDDFLKRTPPQPDQRGMVTCGDMITPFLVQTRVENSGVLVAGTDKTLPLEYALKGALGVEQFAGWRDQFFTTYLTDSRRFLTWQPAEKWVDVNQPEFLYYLVNFTPKPTEIRVRVGIIYDDHSTEVLTAMKSVASQYTVYSIPVGFTALGLPAQEVNASRGIHSYQVWLSNEADQRLSEVRTYYVNRAYEPNIRYLLFANSLGGYDTLRCTGQSNSTLTVKGTAAQRALTPNYLPSTGELFSLNRLGERVLTVNTGLRDGDTLDYLSELILSEELYVVTQEGFVALAPTDATLNLRTDDEDLNGRTLSYRYAKNEVGYSGLPMAPMTPARATVWVPINTYCLINENGLRTGYLTAAKLELRYADDGSLVKPLRSKANSAGTEGYTPPTLSGACSSTPFVNALIEVPGSYKRNNCGADLEPTVATLSLAAGMYGAETADQLQARTDQALRALDTQAYANVNGSCLVNPAGYTYAVPVNRWHYRANSPSRIGIETYDSPYMGNAWTMQGRGSGFVFPVGSNDLDFPTTSFDGGQWRIFVYGKAGAQARLRLYRNGTVYRDETFAFNSDGFEYRNLFTLNTYGPPYAPIASQDKVYIQLTDL
jgi:hypothetical protein